MSKIITVGLDLAKNVFVASGASSIQAHGADAVDFHPKLSRFFHREVSHF